MSMCFIFLAIMDTLPHWRPPAEPRLKPMPPLAGSQHELTFTWLKAMYKSNSKLCSCLLKTVQTTDDVLHIQTLCNSANHSKTVQIGCSCTDDKQTISHKFHFNLLHLVVVRLWSKNHHCSTQTSLRLTFHLN